MGRLTIMALPLIRRLFPHRFGLAMLTRFPLLGRWIDRALFHEDHLLILPRDGTVRTIETDIRAEQEDLVLPSSVVEELVRRSEHRFLMDFCICRTSNLCQDYPRGLGCLFLGEAATRIDHRLGRRVSVEEALDHLRRCREEGLVHLVGRNKLDSVWLGARPRERLMTVCSCCPCCCLWRMIPHLREDLGRRVRGMPGLEVRLDGSICTGCGTCLDSCFLGAISLVEGRASIDRGLCRGCGRCADVCPQGAIGMALRPGSAEELVEELDSLADIHKE
ncbi:MAG: DUF362 domain-containing protein [Methanomassiliicoccales archaeon]